MTNVVSLTTKEVVTFESIEQHLENIREELARHPGVSKALTILIDEKAGVWELHHVYCNVNNGAAFMALRLAENRLLNDVHEL